MDLTRNLQTDGKTNEQGDSYIGPPPPPKKTPNKNICGGITNA